MPPYARGQKRINMTYVEANSKVLFGFTTKDFAAITGVSAADLTAIGHMTPVEAAALTARIPVIGASAPRPPRVTKKVTPDSTSPTTSQGSVSTYAGYNKIGTAQTAGWRLSKAGMLYAPLKPPSATKRSQTVIANLSNGARYCYSLNAQDFTTYGAAFGLESSTTITTQLERETLIRGCRIPRPGRARVELANGSFQTFYGVGATLEGADVMATESLLDLGSAPTPP